jgi:hypothetical protein
MLDLNRIRSVPELLATALRLYGRYPLQFIVLAACVVVPYEVIVQLVTNATPLGNGNVSAGTALLLDLISVALIGPLVSALQVQALFAVGDGDHPRPNIVFERALRVLPTVVAAEIIAGIGIAIGILLFIIPGVYLALRWAVVAQVAAAEQVDWPGAIRRSGELARGNYLRVIAVVVTVAVVTLVVSSVGHSIAGNSSKIGPVAIEIAVVVLVQSFASLMTALLYFDLYAREGASQ